MTSETSQPIEANAPPELKQVLGALLFAARKPIAVDELLAVLAQVAQNDKDAAHSFGKIKESDIRTALEQLKTEFAERKLGLILVEVAGGFRLQTDPAGGPWVRHLLNLDKPARLSKPALETLAIIAYRQPATRAEIEALRGVNVDAMMRHLLELQLIRIMGRSDLPGRPLMYGTTQLFLEHFGLSSIKNLPGIEQLSRRDAEHVKREIQAAGNGQQTTEGGPAKTEDGSQTPDATPEGKEGTADDAQPPEEEEDEYDEDEDEDDDEGEDEDKGDEGRN
ncbi:MAG: SMC-Scp complex subunit ScpB [Kiritimatiellae bacterium]|nr:SMC-Scp complex subunit ScpB [Kiritimatiellia bacterium]